MIDLRTGLPHAKIHCPRRTTAASACYDPVRSAIHLDRRNAPCRKQCQPQQRPMSPECRKRLAASIAAVKARAMSWRTSGMVSREQIPQPVRGAAAAGKKSPCRNGTRSSPQRKLPSPAHRYMTRPHRAAAARLAVACRPRARAQCSTEKSPRLTSRVSGPGSATNRSAASAKD